MCRDRSGGRGGVQTMFGIAAQWRAGTAVAGGHSGSGKASRHRSGGIQFVSGSGLRSEHLTASEAGEPLNDR